LILLLFICTIPFGKWKLYLMFILEIVHVSVRYYANIIKYTKNERSKISASLRGGFRCRRKGDVIAPSLRLDWKKKIIAGGIVTALGGKVLEGVVCSLKIVAYENHGSEQAQSVKYSTNCKFLSFIFSSKIAKFF